MLCFFGCCKGPAGSKVGVLLNMFMSLFFNHILLLYGLDD